MFGPTQGHPQSNKERTRNNKLSTQWDLFLIRHCRLKDMSAQHFRIFVLTFLDPIECSFYCFLYVLCWPEDGPVSTETCCLNVNIIDFNTLLS
jgi:hypothetical protein